MNTLKIFVIEDDAWYGEFLKHHISMDEKHEVSVFKSGEEALNNLDQKPDVITLDYSLPDYTGQELLKKLLYRVPQVKVIMVSGQEDISTAIELINQGAYDYIVKNPNAGKRLWTVLRNIKENLSLNERLNYLEEEVQEKYSFSNIIKGNSPEIQKVFTVMAKAVRSDINVSITGETGTGKELIAKAIHHNSKRKDSKFVPVNVAAIPSELIESELFGHEKGAFTGAATARVGRFEEADGGTIFLDEIGELELSLQAKLLRVLQESEVVRVGSNKAIKINVRILTATHKNLVEEVKKGTFREDLYYRIIGLPVHLPPLRERRTDIIPLTKFFLEDYSKKNQIPSLKLTPDGRDKMLNYSYPGNIRELKSIVELACVMSDTGEISEEDITFHSLEGTQDILSEDLTLRQYNIKILREYIKKYNNNITKVAKKLDIGRSTVYQMLKEAEHMGL